MTMYNSRVHPSPIGDLTIIAGTDGIRQVRFAMPDGSPAGGSGVPADMEPAAEVERHLAEAGHQLDEYFAGERHDFDLVLDPVGTEFQLRAWSALRQISYGTTATYGQQAARIGSPAAVRAVGAANGRNPIPIIVPCPRVVGADGSLTGFGGGLAAKRFLLDLESGTAALSLF